METIINELFKGKNSGIAIYRGDITKLPVDAIVNAAKPSLLGGGGVDGAIHEAAGEDLYKECRLLNGCEVGEAKITKGYQLPAKYVIHTVGPFWYGGAEGESELLSKCYRNSLLLARQNNCKSIAFPAISTRIYRYPKELAAKVAFDTIRDFLKDHDMQVILVAFTVNDELLYNLCMV